MVFQRFKISWENQQQEANLKSRNWVNLVQDRHQTKLAPSANFTSTLHRTNHSRLANPPSFILNTIKMVDLPMAMSSWSLTMSTPEKLQKQSQAKANAKPSCCCIHHWNLPAPGRSIYPFRWKSSEDGIEKPRKGDKFLAKVGHGCFFSGAPMPHFTWGNRLCQMGH